MSKNLHIVTHDVPYPADFGGVIDLYYKIKSLHEAGIKIHLHCFVKSRPPQPELEKYCEAVHYYKRKTLNISFRLPYIVSSRNHYALVKNLQADHHPVLLEGIHCSYHLFNGHLKGRKVFLRLHNTEYKYYAHLAKHENNLLKKAHYNTESKLLRKYESQIANLCPVICVSKTDQAIYTNEFKAEHALFLPVFLPWQDLNSKTEKDEYCLYNGNLSVNENEKAALWLINEIFSKTKIRFIIAGKSPSQKLISSAGKFEHISVVANPDEMSMQTLIENAQVNVLPSMNATGVKLKMLNALFNGRHCLTNTAGSEGSGVEELCHNADDSETFLQKTKALFNEDFSNDELQKRRSALKLICNNELNAKKLIAWIW